MITLNLLLRLFNTPTSRNNLFEWCKLINTNNDSVYDLVDYLEEVNGLELNDVQVDMLIDVCNSEKFYSVFN
jgi:hypothetical protein